MVKAHERRWSFDLPAEFGHRDITAELLDFVTATGVRVGTLTAQLVGSTGGLTTIEYEPGALADLRRAFDRIAATGDHYEHNARWGDGNGFSHVRSAILGTDFAVPITGGQLALGTWQQVVVINFDNRARSREMIAVCVGEE